MTQEEKQKQEERAKDIIKALVEAIDNKNKGVPLDKLSDLASLTKSYKYADNMATALKIIDDNNKAAALGYETSKLVAASLAMKYGIKYSNSLPIKNKKVKSAIAFLVSGIFFVDGEKQLGLLKNVYEMAQMCFLFSLTHLIPDGKHCFPKKKPQSAPTKTK